MIKINDILRKGKRLIIPMAIVLSGVMILLWMKKPWLSPESKEVWVSVKPQLLENQLGLIGKIQPAQSEILTAPFDGIIRSVAVHEGQRVEKGQLLIEIDPGQIEIQLRQAQAELLKTRKDVKQLLGWESSPEVSRAKWNLSSIRTRLGNIRANLRDTQSLYERGIVARMEVDSLIQQVQSQQQELRAAEEELRLTESRGKGEELEIAQMMLENARSRYQSLAVKLQQQRVIAPFTGLIVRPTDTERGKDILVQAGMQVNQGEALMNIIGLEHIQIQTRVEEADVHRIKEGMPVEVTGDGFEGQNFKGNIRNIAVQSDPRETQGAYFNVIVSVNAPSEIQRQNIRLGMNARLSIITYQNKNGFVVPAQALNIDEPTGETYVIYRRLPKISPHKVVITTGNSVAQGVEVYGIESGEILIKNMASQK